MALSCSMPSKCSVTPPPSSITKLRELKPRSSSLLGLNKYNNVFADLVYKNPSLATRKASYYSPRSVKSLKVVGIVTPKEEQEVVVIDGLRPAILTPPQDVKRSDFPIDFKFGASTSALQTEGKGTEGGRGPSTWDFMIQASQGRKAADSYYQYPEDVKLLKNMGMNSYRFSIAWPRILPQGNEELGEINQEGIDFYNKFIDELIKNDIEPVVTLFHFDLPVALQKKYYGFISSKIIEDFTRYADICFEAFGDRVKLWSTINEPFVYGSYGYKMGLPDDIKNDTLGPYIATHNIIVAHGSAAKLYHEKYQKDQKGKIGISLPSKWFEPYSNDPKDVDAANKHLDFMLGWYMDPFVNGDYPESMKQLVKGLPEFTKDEKKMVREACDYIGVNYYTARFAKLDCIVDSQDGLINVQYREDTVDTNGNSIGEQAEGQDQIYVHPDGLKNLLLYIKDRYGNHEVYVTENGVPAAPKIAGSIQDLISQGNTKELEAAFFDDYRISHAQDHLIAIREANKEGANVKGHFVWTLMDNMEVGAGYDCRFGLNYVDYYDNCKRYPKKSAMWYANFLKETPQDNKNKGINN